MPQPLNVAILGMGMSATVFHIPFMQALPKLFNLHTIMERSATPENSAARTRYGSEVRVVTTYEDVLADKAVDVVCVLTPNATHFPYAKAALEAGKHVILEKPLCPSAHEVAALIALARAQTPPVLLAAFQNRRFDSDFRTLQRLVGAGPQDAEGAGLDGVFGEIVELATHYDRWRPALRGGGTWKEAAGPGQGIAYDLGAHLIDQVLALFGAPTSISAHIYNARGAGPADYDDTFAARFFYARGAGGRVRPLGVSLAAGVLSLVEPQTRFVVKGTRASWVKRGMDAQEAQLQASPPLPLSDPAFGLEAPEIAGVLTTLDPGGRPVANVVPSEKGSYLDWYELTGCALLARDASLLPTTAEQSRDVIHAIELMYESSREGRVVPWSEVEA